MEYTVNEYKQWETEQKIPEVSDRELMLIIKRRWGLLYEKLQKHEITTKEYAVRRRIYENMIYEIGSLLNEFINDKEIKVNENK
jgi:hypothetical protein